MRNYLAILIGCLAISSPQAQAAPLRICYFSLNNDKEFHSMRAYADKIQGKQEKIIVEEFLPYGEYPSEGFAAMAERSQRCDGLVLSGHHREQGFEGSRVPGFLPIDFLEQLSCKAETQAWFQNIKAVWLQGCATSGREGSEETMQAPRYGKIFPNATIFAWSGSAPSKIAPLTIPYQLQNLVRLPDADSKDPLQGLLNILSGKSEEKSRLAWLKLRESGKSEFHGIFNHSAQAFLPFSQTARSTEISNGEIGRCFLSRGSKESERLAEIHKILSDRESLLQNLRKLRAELKNAQKYPNYREKLAALAAKMLHAQWMEEILRSRAAIAQKITAYRLYSELRGDKRFPILESRLSRQVLRELNRKRTGLDHVERKHLFDHIVLAAMEAFPDGENLLPANIVAAISSSDPLNAILRAITSLDPKNSVPLLAAIARNKNANDEVLYFLAASTRVLHPYNAELIFKNILGSANASAKTRQLAEESRR